MEVVKMTAARELPSVAAEIAQGLRQVICRAVRVEAKDPAFDVGESDHDDYF
jgi:hypothetical protein